MSDGAMMRTHDALSELLECHEQIVSAYSELPVGLLDQLLGNLASGPLRRQLRQYGDGYTMRSVPARTDQVTCKEDVVLIAWKFPLLGERSEFCPCRPLPEIPYWNHLRPTLRMPDGSVRRLRFLIWQECCPVHGGTIDDALCNRNLIRCRSPELDGLFDQQAKLSRRLLLAWADWLRDASPRRWLVIVADCGLAMDQSRVAGLLDGGTLLIEMDLKKDRRKIMTKIEERLWEVLGFGSASRLQRGRGPSN